MYIYRQTQFKLDAVEYIIINYLALKLDSFEPCFQTGRIKIILDIHNHTLEKNNNIHNMSIIVFI